MGMKNKGIAITYFKNSNFKTDTYYQQECFKHQLYIAKKAGPEVRINAIRKLFMSFLSSSSLKEG